MKKLVIYSVIAFLSLSTDIVFADQDKESKAGTAVMILCGSAASAGLIHYLGNAIGISQAVRNVILASNMFATLGNLADSESLRQMSATILLLGISAEIGRTDVMRPIVALIPFFGADRQIGQLVMSGSIFMALRTAVEATKQRVESYYNNITPAPPVEAVPLRDVLSGSDLEVSISNHDNRCVISGSLQSFTSLLEKHKLFEVPNEVRQEACRSVVQTKPPSQVVPRPAEIMSEPTFTPFMVLCATRGLIAVAALVVSYGAYAAFRKVQPMLRGAFARPAAAPLANGARLLFGLDELACVVCFENFGDGSVRALLQPCFHVTVCAACALALNPRNCPTCRGPIS